MNTNKHAKNLTGGSRESRGGLSFLLCCLCCLMCNFPAWAGDINAGITFLANQKNINAAQLNSIVGGATINPSFITDRSVASPVAADSFIFYSASGAGLRRASFDGLFLSNTNLIFGQNELNTPATNDYVLVLRTSTGLLAKSSVNALVLTNTDLINTRLEATNPLPANAQFLVASNGQNYRVGLTNVFREWWRWGQFSSNTYYDATPTNTSLLSLYTRPTNADQLLIWDAHNATNKAITLASLMTNPPTPATLTNADRLLLFATATNAANLYGTNGVFSSVTVTQLGRFTAQQAVFTNMPINNAGATVFTNAHGFPAIPQYVRCVLVCTNAELGYGVGDEVDLNSFYVSTQPPGCVSADATNVYFSAIANAVGITVCTKTAGSITGITKSKWNAKLYTTYYP